MRRFIAILTCLAALTAFAADPDVIATRAARAFAAGEWASAHAMYVLVSDAKPMEAMPYGRAVVASLMRNDTTATTTEIRRALANGVALDSVLAVIEKESLALGKGNMYVGELHRISAEMPYLRRPVDARLLRYYIFRYDAPQIIRYSQTLLKGLPDSPVYLNTLAKGYSLNGQKDMAEQTWRHILELDSDNLEALVCLGNALRESDPQSALTYLFRANEIHPTPYLQATIRSLSARNGEAPRE